MRQKILEFVMEHGMLLHPQAADHILSQKDPLLYTENALKRMKEPAFIITPELLLELETDGSGGSITLEQTTPGAIPNSVRDIVVQQSPSTCELVPSTEITRQVCTTISEKDFKKIFP